MLKKRIIFTLLYADGYFCQSRNYNIQKVGNLEWLIENYNFKNISYYIDELVVLNISRKNSDINQFIKVVKSISKNCFVPVSCGGGIRDFEYANLLLAECSDKILLNSSVYENPKILKSISKVFGGQSIIVSVDFKKKEDGYDVFIQDGKRRIEHNFNKYINLIKNMPFGEIFLNSIDRDGTGMGLEYDILNQIPNNFEKPIILSGGCGNSKHIAHGITNYTVNAISTSNLLNFVGDGLKKCREKLLIDKIDFPKWNIEKLKKLKYSLSF